MERKQDTDRDGERKEGGEEIGGEREEGGRIENKEKQTWR